MDYSYSEVVDCAKRLYSLAAAIIRGSTAAGGLGGAIVGGWIGAMVGKDGVSSPTVILVLFGVAVGAAIGYEVGRTRAVHLRLQAQNALGQMEMHRLAYGRGSGSERELTVPVPITPREPDTDAPAQEMSAGASLPPEDDSARPDWRESLREWPG